MEVTMTRGILQLILVGIVLISQLPLSLADAEYSDEDIVGSRESGPQSGSPVTSDSAIAQYLLGVIEYNEGNVELARVWFQQAWGSLETAEDEIAAQKTQAFGRALDKSTPPAAAKVQFPEGYKVNVYYRDGWYIQPKNSSVEEKQVYSFLPGSSYKIRLEVENEHPARKRINTGMKVIAAFVMISWLMSR
jgi:hypothetical protein